MEDKIKEMLKNMGIESYRLGGRALCNIILSYMENNNIDKINKKDLRVIADMFIAADYHDMYWRMKNR